MIVLTDEGQPFQIARAEARESLSGLELEIDLIAHVAAQPIDLLGVVDRGPYAAVYAALHRHRFGKGRAKTQQRAEPGCRRPQSPRNAARSSPTVHDVGPSQPAVPSCLPVRCENRLS